jgi:hypothetical protein
MIVGRLRSDKINAFLEVPEDSRNQSLRNKVEGQEENEENLKLPRKSDGFGLKLEERNGRGGEI